MRKFILAVTALLGFSVFAHAQLGVMAGVTSSESNFKSAWFLKFYWILLLRT